MAAPPVAAPARRAVAPVAAWLRHLDCLVVRARDEVRSVAPRKVLDAVDALLMPLQREVRLRRVEAPDLRSARDAQRRNASRPIPAP
eukprot:scaffold14086_cov131-Isochrysis_galbana.AAC.5